MDHQGLNSQAAVEVEDHSNDPSFPSLAEDIGDDPLVLLVTNDGVAEESPSSSLKRSVQFQPQESSESSTFLSTSIHHSNHSQASSSSSFSTHHHTSPNSAAVPLDWNRSSLYGRTHELNVLVQATQEAQQQSVQTVTLTGVSGSGKTALLDQFCAVLEYTHTAVVSTSSNNSSLPDSQQQLLHGSLSYSMSSSRLNVSKSILEGGGGDEHENRNSEQWHKKPPCLLCRGKFEEMAAETTQPCPTVVDAMRQLVDGLVQHIDEQEADTLQDNNTAFSRESWKEHLTEALDSSEVSVLSAILPNLRRIVRANSVAQLVLEESDSERSNSYWTRHFSERLPTRRQLVTGGTSSSHSTTPHPEDTNSSRHSTDANSHPSKTGTAMAGLSRWFQMSTHPGMREGHVRSHSDVQLRARPTLSSTTSTEDVATNFRKDWSFDRLRLALRTLIRVISSQVTVIVALDDIQWADQESLIMLQTILSDEIRGRRLLFVTTMRTDHNAVPKSLKVITDQNQTLFLSNLSKEIVSQWIQSLLRQDEDEVRSLVDVVHRKTAGNPFFVVQFLRLLNQKRFLDFSMEKLKWAWDASKIQAETDVCNNAVDVVVGKMRWLPQDQQWMLAISSCLGQSRVEVKTLYHCLLPTEEELRAVDDKTLIFGSDSESPTSRKIDSESLTQDAVSKHLHSIAEIGLFEKLSESYFKFSHDRVREAANLLIPNQSVKQQLHLRIGRRLRFMVDNLPPSARFSSKRGGNLLLQLVRQLNFGASLLEDEAEKVDLAELNYNAAEIASNRSSFVPAARFLQQGRKLVGSHPWSEYTAIMRKLSVALIRTEYCRGRITQSLELANEILSENPGYGSNLGVYHTKIMCLVQSGRGEEALKLNLDVLDKLGHPFPRRNLSWHVRKEAKKTKSMLRKKSEDELKNLPKAKPDARFETVFDFVEKLFEVSVHSQRPHSEYTALVMMRAIRLTCEHGCFARSGICFVLWGWYLASVGDYEGAILYGKIGLDYASKGEGGIYDARTALLFHSYIYHWSLPYYTGIDPISKAIKAYWDAGAVDLVHIETLPYLSIYFCAGLRLEPLMTDMLRFTLLMKDYHQMNSLESTLPYFQMVANLMGRSPNERTLSGEFMDNKIKAREWTRNGNLKALQKLAFHRMLLAYYFCNYELAWECFQKLGEPQVEDCGVWLPYRHFFQGLIAFACFHETKKRSFLTKGRAITKQMDRWAKRGIVNCKHMDLILKAECIAITCRKVDDVMAAYDSAIALAARSGFLSSQALVNERAGLYCERIADDVWAATYLRRAHALYNDWGAIAKADDILRRHHHLLALEPSGQMNPQGGDFRARTRLDLLTTAHYESLRLSRMSCES